MLAKRIIPCLDVTGGRVVKGVNFVELRDAGDPVEIAARYNEQGADELTFLDITATSDERDLILHIIEAVASQVFIPLTVGGGVRTVEDVRRLLNAGADKTSFNSAGSKCPAAARLPVRPLLNAKPSSFCQSTTSSGRRVVMLASLRVRMTSMAPRVPRSPSKLPPLGTESVWEPKRTGGSESPVPARRP